MELNMVNEAIIRRYMRRLLLAVILIVSVLAFLWINFLYTRFALETQTFSAQQEILLQESVDNRAHRVRMEGERSYLQEAQELQDELETVSDSMKNSIFDLYFTLNSAPDSIEVRMQQLLSQFEQGSGFSFYIQDDTNDQVFGDKPPSSFTFEAIGHSQDDQMLYFSQALRYPKGNFVVYTHLDEEIRRRMLINLPKYLELDPSILVFDEHEVNLAPHAQISTISELEARKDVIYSVEKSDISGFSFGYLISREALDLALASREALFSGFLKNHLLELAAFFLILLVSGGVVFHFFSSSLRRDQEMMNDILLRAYEGKTQLTKEPLFRHFSLTPTLNGIFSDMRLKETEWSSQKEDFELKLKRQQVQLLSLERRIQSLSEESKFTEGVILEKRREEFSLIDLIRSTHEATDPQAPMELRGDSFLLESDPDLLEGILRDFFSLCRKETRRYVIEILRFEEQLQIFFSLTGTDAVDEKVLEHLKLLARNLEGTLLRDMTTDEGLYLSLLFPLRG